MIRAVSRRPAMRAVSFVLVPAVALLAAWGALRAAAIRTLPPGTPALASIAPGDPDLLLTAAMLAAATGRGSLDEATLDAVRHAAGRLPLDDRPFFLSGLRALASGDDDRALRLLETARARNPRARLTRLVLMDRYLRRGDVDAATSEMTVLARLLPSSEDVLAGELARLGGDPATAAQARRALAADPALLDRVLAIMARQGTPPASVTRFAGRNAPAGTEPGGWRRALIDARVAAGDYAGARSLWARAYGIPPAQATAPIYDAGLTGRGAPPPFNWTLAGNEVGAATIARGTLSIEFYGRRSGELATQLLTLPPGEHALRFTVEGIDSGDSSGLSWTLACLGRDAAPLLATPVIRISPTARRVTARFTVPADTCPAQWLRLVGNAGEFAAVTEARIRNLGIGRGT